MDHWPDRLLSGTPREFPVDHLHHNFLKFRDHFDEETKLAYPGQRWLMGYALPPFQRPLVWDEGRMVRFIESAVLGLHIGTYVFNTADRFPDVEVGGQTVMDITDQWLIDGQQRLTALEWFFSDRFQVFGMFWSEVGRMDRLKLLRQPFTSFEISSNDPDYLRELYDRLNFGGVAHTPDQRAVKGEPILAVSGEEPSAPTP